MSSGIALKPLPESKAAEAALLGSMIVGPECVPDVLTIIHGPEDFAHAEHQLLWQMIIEVWERNRGKALDGLLVRSALETSGKIDAVGGTTYLQMVLDSVPSSATYQYYAKIVSVKALRRNMIAAAKRIMDLAQDATVDDMGLLVTQASEFLSEATKRYGLNATPTDMAAILQEAYNEMEARTAPKMTTGFFPLDEHLCGFYPSQMIVVAGRPGMGKSAFALNMSLSASARAQKKPHIIYFSFEMPRVDLGMRVLSWKSGVPFERIRKGDFSPQMAAKVAEALSVSGEANIEIVDSCGATPHAVRNTVRKMTQKEPVDVVIVDYIQRLHCDKDFGTRDREMTVISNNMKDMALELSIPVIAISQLNRGPDMREDHHPRASDLRDSGSVEQDADVILMVYREDNYHQYEKSYTATNEVEIGIIKNRNGSCGAVRLLWDGPTMSFRVPASEDVMAQVEDLGL